MNQITLTKSPKSDPTVFLVGSEAKNPLPIRSKEKTPCTDLAGLSWIFLDYPMGLDIPQKLDKRRCNCI